MSEQQFEITAAIVYADISGSTALYDTAGNQLARAQIEACLTLLREVITEHGGEFVHSRGDDVLCLFENPQNAFSTMKDMLKRTAEGALSVHIGLDYGPAIRTRDDVFGDCVNVAARLANLATPREALSSHDFHTNISQPAQGEMHLFDTRTLRGKARPEKIFRYADTGEETGTLISFAQTDHTRVGGHSASRSGTPSTYVSFIDQTVICETNSEITIGRADSCDLIIPREWVSRKHAVIEMRKDHAYLRDVSSNGTYVCLVGHPPVLLRRETMALPAICTLSPTKNPSDNEAVSITCHVVMNVGAKEP